MTAAQLKEEFLVGYDKVASLAAPGYIDDEISTFLSDAQERFVKTRYTAMGNKYRAGVEETEKRRKELANITETTTLTASATQEDLISSNSVLFDLPADFWLTLNEWVLTTDECEPTKKVVPITHDEYFEQISNPFKKPSSTRVWRMDVDDLDGVNRHEIITDSSTTITSYSARYLKKLTDIDIANNVTSELHDMTHREIVNLAVTIALENSQEPRFQSHSALGGQVE